MNARAQSLLLALLLFVVPTAAHAQIVSAGATHTMAVAPDGTAWAWGYGYWGQLGDGTTTSRPVPVQVSGLTNVVAVATGTYHSLALKSDGTVWAWGMNWYGQLGDSTTTARNVPVYVQVLTDVVAIAVGQSHSLAIKSDGTIWAWGSNSNGQLGNGTTTQATVPTQVSTLSGITSIAAGTAFSLAVKSDGTVWSWGMNSSGQLGNGTTTQSLVPVQASGVSDATAVTAGDCHALARRSDATIRAWGCNSSGQLGDGTWTQRTTAVALSGLADVASVSAGFSHSLARKSDGTVKAWGSNGYGQLGDGTTTTRNAPTAVTGLTNIAALDGGDYHSAAVSSTGVVYGWGYNWYGQVGDGTNVNRSVPTPISDPDFAWRTAAPTLSPAPGSYTSTQNVSIASATAGAVIRYSTDGSEPTASHAMVTGPISVNETMTLKARAFHATQPPSTITSGAYTFNAAPPVFTPAGGTYAANQTVSMTTSTSGGAIRYTVDGTAPTASSPLYTAPITLSSPTTLKASTFKTNWSTSGATSSSFCFSGWRPGLPDAFPGGGTFHTQTVTVGMMPGAADGNVGYSVNGTTPPPGTTYTAPVVLDRTTTVKMVTAVYMYNCGWVWKYSDLLTHVYTVKVAAPTISLASGEYAPGTEIQIINGVTPDAVIRYRLDGQTPTDSDPQIPADGKLLVGNYALTVRAFYHYMDPSDVATATYSVLGTYNGGGIAAGRGHSVALKPDGSVMTWGSNTYRALGYGERWKANYLGGSESEFVVQQATTPLATGITGAKAIAVGMTGDFTVALRSDATVWTWGTNNFGELGRSPAMWAIRRRTVASEQEVSASTTSSGSPPAGRTRWHWTPTALSGHGG